MAKFQYEALDTKTGKTEKGELPANSQAEALARLQEMGLAPPKGEEARKSLAAGPLRNLPSPVLLQPSGRPAPINCTPRHVAERQFERVRSSLELPSTFPGHHQGGPVPHKWGSRSWSRGISGERASCRALGGLASE